MKIVQQDLQSQYKLETNGLEWVEFALKSTSTALLITDRGGKIQCLNPSAQRILGSNHHDLLGQPVDEVLAMWSEDDYDNLKDAILDARSALKEAPPAEKARITRLERMLTAATKHLADLVAEDPTFAAYARGLLPATAKKKAVKKKAVKKKAVKKKAARPR